MTGFHCINTKDYYCNKCGHIINPESLYQGTGCTRAAEAIEKGIIYC